ncbi:MAG: tetratricopeptide repeat protein [Planctomycetota bacterium]|jgi:DNA-directed RNA polymerase subunit alpha
MESITEVQIDLFGENLPGIEELDQLSKHVHSSERNQIEFTERLEQKMSEKGAKAALAQGIGLYIAGRDAEAIERLAKAEDCRQNCIFQAFAMRRTGNYKEALGKLDESLKHEADPLKVALEKTATYRSSGDLDATQKELKNLSNYNNVSAEYHYQLGRLQEELGLYGEAMDNYKVALDLSPEHSDAIFHLAYRCDLSGDEQAAIDYYKQLTVSIPVHVNALLNLAVLYEDMGEYSKAAMCVDKVLEYHPNHPRAILFSKDIESSETMFYDEEKEKRIDRRVQVLETPISDFELSVRSRNCFRKMNIRTLGDLLHINESELLSYKNFGETSLKEIKIILESKGLHLGGTEENPQLVSIETNLEEGQVDENKELLSKSVNDVNLSVRARKCLQKLDLMTLGEVVQKTEAELLGCKNFGLTSLNEIKKALTGVGLSLRTLE